MTHFPHAADLDQRIAGGMWGMLIGDALGVPYEFHSPAGLPALAEIDMVPPPTFDRSHALIAPGTWSDDGAQALCLLGSLLQHKRLDLDDLANRMLRWRAEGYMAVDGLVFDIGVQTATAFRALGQGVSPRDAGPNGEWDNGNGSLMRVAPLALWHRGSDAELIRDAFMQSAITHGHARSKVSCALYCLWLRRLLYGPANDAWSTAVTALRSHIQHDEPAQEALEVHIRPDEPATGVGSGYVVDTLRSVRMIFESDDNAESSLKQAVALGHDTDTTACVLGALLGVRDGLHELPLRWRQAMRGADIAQPLIDSLCQYLHQGGE
jgi:ADP-ribosyl-[dinitrogen reductase] hydrolase